MNEAKNMSRDRTVAAVIALLAETFPKCLHWCLHRTFAVLRAYFDESGIHAGSRTTIICGFIGPRNEWRRVTRKWQKAMNGRVFHYKEMRNETKLLERLAKILAESRLAGINMGFLGDWD